MADVTLHIEKRCPDKCIGCVRKALQDVRGFRSVTSGKEQDTVVVTYEEGITSVAALISALEEADFEASLTDEEKFVAPPAGGAP